MDILEIDGSVLEGGGQILRMSISMSAILGIPIRVNNIRSGRPKPGLAAQHLQGICLVADMCQAKLNGAHIGSTQVEFWPGKLRGGQFTADTQTAGSVSLLLQVALPCALFAPTPVQLDLHGGTNADMAPQIDYVDKIFRNILSTFGGDFYLQIIKRGYFPRGGGHVRVMVSPVQRLRAVELLMRGDVASITGWSLVSGNVHISVARLMEREAKRALGDVAPIYITSYKETKDVSRDNVMAIVLMAEMTSGCVVGADGLVRRDQDPGEVGCAAGGALMAEIESGACLDLHAQDQVIIYMALAHGRSSVRIGELTLHTRTAIHIAELMMGVKFNVVPLSEQNVIQVDGRGVINDSMQ